MVRNTGDPEDHPFTLIEAPMRTLYYAEMESPVGIVSLVSSDRGLVAVDLHSDRKSQDATAGSVQKEMKSGKSPSLLRKMKERLPGANLVPDSGKNRSALEQLNEYFEGKRTEFSLPLDLGGTEFQKKVWKAVSAVPFGETRSYGEIARIIRNPKAVRAVGQANKANPVPLVIPCHRIIGSDGSMTGYGGLKGIPTKVKLLEMEKSVSRIP